MLKQPIYARAHDIRRISPANNLAVFAVQRIIPARARAQVNCMQMKGRRSFLTAALLLTHASTLGQTRGNFAFPGSRGVLEKQTQAAVFCARWKNNVGRERLIV